MTRPLLTVLLVISATPALATECMRYGSGAIEGQLVLEKVTPTHGQQVEWSFFVKPDNPVCFLEGAHPQGYEPSLEGVTRIQLIHPDKTGYEQARELKGKRVSCLGTLFGKWTEHHHSPVLMRGTCIGAQPEQKLE